LDRVLKIFTKILGFFLFFFENFLNILNLNYEQFRFRYYQRYDFDIFGKFGDLTRKRKRGEWP